MIFVDRKAKMSQNQSRVFLMASPVTGHHQAKALHFLAPIIFRRVCRASSYHRSVRPG